MIKSFILAAALGLGVVAVSPSAKAQSLTVEIGAPPARIETYPRYVYEGQPVYYYEGHWYEQRGPRWVYYRDEPRVLYEHRVGPHRHVHEHRVVHEHRHHHHHHHH